MTPLRPRSFFPLAATPETNPRKHIKAFSPLQLFSLSCLTKLYLQWQYPVLAKAKQKVAERLKEWRENGWSKPAVPGNCNNNPLLAVDKKLAGVVAFDNIRLCIDARQLNTLNRTKKRTYVLPRIADILKKARK